MKLDNGSLNLIVDLIVRIDILSGPEDSETRIRFLQLASEMIETELRIEQLERFGQDYEGLLRLAQKLIKAEHVDQQQVWSDLIETEVA